MPLSSLGNPIADVYAWRGEHDKAFEWLERAYEWHDGGLIFLPYDRYFAKMGADPRFQALLTKLKLPT